MLACSSVSSANVEDLQLVRVSDMLKEVEMNDAETMDDMILL